MHSLAFGGRGLFVTNNRPKINQHNFYDMTLGFPGEGTRSKRWSKKHTNFTAATWNTRSLTKVQFNYCKRLNYDILALTETWRNEEKFADGTIRWTYSRDAVHPQGHVQQGEPIYPDDPAAGCRR